MPNNVWFWIVILAVLVLTLAVVTGLTLAHRRRINLAEAPERDEDDGRRRDSGYSAGGGIALAPGGQAETTEPPLEHPAGERTEVDGQPGVGDDAAVPRDVPRRGMVDVGLPDDSGTSETGLAPTAGAGDEPEGSELPGAPTAAPDERERAHPGDVAGTISPRTEQAAPEQADQIAEIEPAAGRIERLRGRLSKSRSALGQSLLGLLGAGDLDEDSWQDIEDTLLVADLGAETTTEVVETLRTELSARGVRSAEQAKVLLRDVLIGALRPEFERAVKVLPHEVDGVKQPGVVLIAGVNGTGKTTTTGKLARVLIAQGHQVVLGAADTFRAAAADQLQTWSERVGAAVVRGSEGADPASVAYDAVQRGRSGSSDAVLVDTAGRLHTKTGLMDELGKVKRVVEKQSAVDEVLLVLDATTGQNGLAQARVFSEVIDVTGIVLTKLDGTAKGGIVFQVQRELGVPVKLVGLGEGPDDLAPFEPEAFVDALLG